MRTSDYPSPLRHFLAQLEDLGTQEDLRTQDDLDMDKVGRLLVELAADEDYLGPLAESLPSASTGGTWLICPPRGPRLVLFHRPDGAMARTHSHSCWVAIAPVRGVETHQRWDAICRANGTAELHLADERALHSGDVVTLMPPRDIHSHGHVAGTGGSPYSLILLGDDMLAFQRTEFDLRAGRWRKLPPGDPGRGLD